MKTIYHPGYVSLVQALKRRRLELGMTQQDVAARLGCCRTRLAKIEQCELRMDVLAFWQLCNVYRINPSGLLALLGKESPPA